jgi:hypothetical protein
MSKKFAQLANYVAGQPLPDQARNNVGCAAGVKPTMMRTGLVG